MRQLVPMDCSSTVIKINFKKFGISMKILYKCKLKWWKRGQNMVACKVNARQHFLRQELWCGIELLKPINARFALKLGGNAF